MVRWRLPGQGRPGTEEVARRDRDRAALVQAQLPGGHGKRAGRVEGVRPPVHDDAVRGPEGSRRLLPLHGPRLPRARGRGGHRDRHGHVLALCGGARLRDAGEPALAGRAHRGGNGPGHRDGPLRGVRLRRRRPVADLELPGLSDPLGDGGPGTDDRPRRDAVALHAARRQGRRGRRPDDGTRRHQRCGQRRVVPARRPPHRTADDPGADPVGAAGGGAHGWQGRLSGTTGPVAVVTGANRGIGRAITVALVTAGFTVAASARDPASLADTVAEAGKAGGTAVPVGCDVRDEASVMALAERAERLGPVHTVVAKIGRAGPTAPLHEITLADWRETIAVDLDGVFLTFRAFIPAMIGRRAGSLIAISSITGKRPLHGRTPYAAAKMGVIGLVRTLATELGPHNIRVNAICPGFVAGPRIEQVLRRQAAVRGIPEETVRGEVTGLSPLRRMVRPEEVAATCVYLASGHSAAVTGEDLNVTAGVVMY